MSNKWYKPLGFRELKQLIQHQTVKDFFREHTTGVITTIIIIIGLVGLFVTINSNGNVVSPTTTQSSENNFVPQPTQSQTPIDNKTSINLIPLSFNEFLLSSGSRYFLIIAIVGSIIAITTRLKPWVFMIAILPLMSIMFVNPSISSFTLIVLSTPVVVSIFVLIYRRSIW